MHPNYYEILGVSKASTPDEIKKAFRNKAKEHHPDKGGDENVFKNIQEAYEVLSDPEKKHQYDNPDPFANFGGNSRAYRGQNPFEGDMFGDFFSQFFGRGEPGFGYNFQKKGGDVRLHISITTKECYEGAAKTIRYRRSVKGKMSEEVKTVQIPKNVDGAVTLRMRGAGHGPSSGEDNPALYGDLMLTVTITPDIFTKDELNLVYEMQVDPVDLLIGKEQIIPHYDGDLRVTLPERTNPNFLLRVQGKGFHLSEHEVGDLMIRLVLTNEVVLPQALKEQLQQYKQQKNDQ